MTEDEAKTKWCPHAVASHTDPRQKLGAKEWLHACIGSACMAWRWSIFLNPDYVPADYSIFPGRPAIGDQFVQSNTHGYCGLAGKP